jgi:hypothetical protein
VIGEANQRLAELLAGRNPRPIDSGAAPDDATRQLADLLNTLFAQVEEIRRFIVPLSRGELDAAAVPSPRNLLSSPFKDLHAALQHLSWQAGQVARGDYGQRVDFMGEFSRAFNAMVESLDESKCLLTQRIEELEKALGHISRLEGILPICAHCKKVRLEGADPRDSRGWVAIESYISRKTEAQFSHSICPDCMARLYPDPRK